MIRLHRLGHPDEPFHLNPDLLATVEGTPDTVVTLTTGVRMIVAEAPEEIVEAVQAWRAAVLSRALRSGSHLTLVRGSGGEAAQ